MGDPERRSYDVWLACHEDAALAAFAGDPAEVLDSRGTRKWPGIARLLEARAAEVARYDAIWFPDDDLALGPADVERLFEVFHALGLSLAQPALADGSYFSAAVTLACPAFVVRYTNFAESMAPVLSREALARVRGTLAESDSGWGVDWIWPRLLGDPTDRIAIVDAVEVLHTRRVGSGAWYGTLAERPAAEARRLAGRYGVPVPFVFRQYGGIPSGAGLRRDAVLPAGPAFMWRLLRHGPRSQRLRGWFWRRQWRSVVAGRRALRRR